MKIAIIDFNKHKHTQIDAWWGHVVSLNKSQLNIVHNLFVW